MGGIRVHENASLTLTVGTTANPTISDTSSETVSARVTPVGGGTTTELGTASGAAAGSNIAITLDFSLVESGLYELEVLADVGSTTPITLIPNDTVGWPYTVDVYHTVAVT